MKNLCGFFLEFRMQKVEKMKAEMHIKSILHSNFPLPENYCIFCFRKTIFFHQIQDNRLGITIMIMKYKIVCKFHATIPYDTNNISETYNHRIIGQKSQIQSSILL